MAAKGSPCFREAGPSEKVNKNIIVTKNAIMIVAEQEYAPTSEKLERQ